MPKAVASLLNTLPFLDSVGDYTLCLQKLEASGLGDIQYVIILSEEKRAKQKE